MKLKDLIFKYRKIIMLALVLVSVIIIITAMYVTEYNNNKVTREDVLTSTPSGEYKDSNEFLKLFDTFKIYMSDEQTVMFDDNGEVLQHGSRTFTIDTKLKENADIQKDVYVTLGLGANWVKYIATTSRSKIYLGESGKIKFSNVDALFPLQGDLLFLPKLEPTLYVLIEWSNSLNKNFYTYLEYEYSVYSIKPSK